MIDAKPMNAQNRQEYWAHEFDVSEIDIEALKSQKEEAWEVFFQIFDPLIQSIPRWSKWGFDAQLQEDIAQTVRSEMLKSIHGIEDRNGLGRLIWSITKRRCIDQVRRRLRRDKTFLSECLLDRDGDLRPFDPPESDAYSPVRAVARMEYVEELKNVMKGMSPTCQSVVGKFYFLDWKYREIAEEEGITVNAVAFRLQSCLRKLMALAKKNPILSTLIVEGFDI